MIALTDARDDQRTKKTQSIPSFPFRVAWANVLRRTGNRPSNNPTRLGARPVSWKDLRFVAALES